MACNHVVEFFFHGYPNRKLGLPYTRHFANPGYLKVKRGQTVKFVMTNTDGDFWIPNADELFNCVGKDLKFPVNSGKESAPYTVSSNAPLNKEFQYSVFCDDDKGNRGFAQWASSPRIIVERDESGESEGSDD